MNALTALMPRRGDYHPSDARALRSDLVAGVTVGIVALPLALAFGATSGLGASAGVITAIVAGLVAGIFGGSDVQVSGPTGAMTVVLAPIVVRYGADGVLLVGFLAGLLIIAGALGRIGRLLTYVPWPVVEGFTLGIAVIIFLQQIPAAFGVARPEGESTLVVAVTAITRWFAAIDGDAFLLVGIVAVVMFIVPKVARALPASLLAVIAATATASLADLDVARIGELPRGLSAPSLPFDALGRISELLPAAIAVAGLAALESLLSARVAAGMPGGGRFDPDRELFGQGLANVASSLFGGLPATGAIARTAVNVRGGARTRRATIVHAFVLFLAVAAFGPVVADIPLPALAGVLMVTAVRMIERHNIRAVLRTTRGDALVLGITAAATVLLDLVVAVELGMAAAAVLALRAVANAATPVAEHVALAAIPSESDEEEGVPAIDHVLTYRLDGALFFGAAHRFLVELTSLADVRVVILRFADLQHLDATGAKVLGEIVRELEDRGITVLFKGMSQRHERSLEAVGALERLRLRRHIFDSLDRAAEHARRHLSGDEHDPA